MDVDDNACEAIPVEAPAIALEKTNRQQTDNDRDGFGDVGEIIEYTFRIENTGSSTLSTVRLIDRRLESRGGVFTGCDVPSNTGAGELQLINPLATGEVVVCTGEYTITQEDIDNRSITNTAAVIGSSSNGQNVSARASAVFTNFENTRTVGRLGGGR